MKNRLDSAWPALILGLLAYALYASFTDAWPMGWINLAQQSVFGSYSVKFSFLLFVFVALILAALVWSVVDRFAARRTAASGAAPPPSMPRQTPTQTQQLVRVGAGFVAALWLGGFAAFYWYSQQQRADNGAEYRPWQLDDNAAGITAAGDHLAVQGVVLATRVVVSRSGSGSSGRDDHQLLPLVSIGWREGQAVRLVVEVKDPSQLPGHSPMAAGRPWVLPQPLLVRVGAPLALTAISEFGKIGVSLAADHHVLHVIASRDGKPVQQDTDYLQFTLWVCGAGSAVLILMFGLSAWRVNRSERPERPGA